MEYLDHFPALLIASLQCTNGLAKASQTRLGTTNHVFDLWKNIYVTDKPSFANGELGHSGFVVRQNLIIIHLIAELVR